MLWYPGTKFLSRFEYGDMVFSGKDIGKRRYCKKEEDVYVIASAIYILYIKVVKWKEEDDEVRLG